ncbi:hypothetical protein IGI04_038809 [Brassica rapa subsp. trilocularis]|uniref:Uncharacterized protein n=1 Tax=Brassica rapa subsp. trilocularis TaxID=1813537 RepID=A0ABQ7LLB4_BRACM|nr:hypothetical protein IGI04_038809 [Brassica rapa subsp. trilocularis]
MFKLGHQWVNSERKVSNSVLMQVEAIYLWMHQGRLTGLYYAFDFQKLNEGAYNVTSEYYYSVMVRSGDQNFESLMRSMGETY